MKIIDTIDSLRAQDVLQKRASGVKLIPIGNEYGITRERVRQLEREASIQIKMAIKELLERDKSPKVLTPSLLKIDEEDLPIINYAFKNYPDKEIKYSNFLNIIYIANEVDIDKEIELFISDKNAFNYETLTKDVFVKLETIYGEIKIDKEYLEKELKRKGFYKLVNDYSKGKTTVSKALMHHFDRTLEIIDTSNNEDMDKLRLYINETYDVNTPTRKALLNRIQETLTLVGKSKYGSIKLSNHTQITIRLIANHIKRMASDRITYKDLFNIFKDELEQNTNITNEDFLHGVMSFEEKRGAEFQCTKYYAFKPDVVLEERINFFKEVEEYIADQKVPISIREIQHIFRTKGTLVLNYTMNYFPNIVRWGIGEVFDVNNIILTKETMSSIERDIEKLLDNELGYTSIYKVDEKVYEKYKHELLENGIDQPAKLMNFIKNAFKEKWAFKLPHITVNKEDFNTEKLVRLLINNKKTFLKSEFEKKVEHYFGNKNSGIDLAFKIVTNDYYKLSGDEYIKKEFVKLKDKNKLQQEIINNTFGEVIILNDINLEGLFEVKGYQPTSWILASYVDQNLTNEYRVVGQIHSYSSINPTIAVTLNSSIKSKKEAQEYLIKRISESESDQEKIVEMFKQINIYPNNTTREEILEILRKEGLK